MSGQKRKRILIRKSTAALLLIPLTFFAYGQTHRSDSLKLKLVNARDTVRPFLLNGIAQEITDSISRFPSNQTDSLLQVAKDYVIEAEALSRKLNYNSGIGTSLVLSGDIKVNQALSNFDKSITDYTNALPYLRASKDLPYEVYCLNRIATACHFVGRLDSSIAYYDSAISCLLHL